MNVFEELRRRGLISQMSNEDSVRHMLTEESVPFYIGYDPTADSLHVGHMLQLVVMAHMQRAGHKPVAVLGTGTTLIGDPSGRSDMRKMLSQEQINMNAQKFYEQMSRFIDFDTPADNRAEMVRNGDWLIPLNYLEFMRDIGRHFSVNKMLTAECFKSRLEQGLSFLEFNYMLLQSYDFFHLYNAMGVRLQLGGDDQWSNILAGADLIRRVNAEKFGDLAGEKPRAEAMTFALLTNSEGKKMGKTESGAVWLDAEKMPPYEFFQYFRNVPDADVIKVMKFITFIPVEEIEQMEKNLSGSQLNTAKERLAYEVTKMVHGEDAADAALKTARSVFAGSGADAPVVEVNRGVINICDLLVLTKQCTSKSDARRNVDQGGVSVDGEKAAISTEINVTAEGVLVKKGKKSLVKVVCKS